MTMIVRKVSEANLDDQLIEFRFLRDIKQVFDLELHFYHERTCVHEFPAAQSY